MRISVSSSRLNQRLVTACLILGLGAADTAFAKPPAVSDREAYETAIRCFYADMYVVSVAQDRGDAARTARFETSARRSFDTAKRLGSGLNLPPGQIDSDFDKYQKGYAARLVHDTAYFASEAAVCKRLGLM